MLDGMLRCLGHRLPRERIRTRYHASILFSVYFSIYEFDGGYTLFLDPMLCGIMMVNMVCCHLYSSILQTDGEPGLIRWGIVIHGFIDGYSRLITGLCASDNNFSNTVLDLFLHGAEVYGVPSCLRGDHGVENIGVAAWMLEHCGLRRYIWGRYKFNYR